jgi:hypothetical protein
MYFNSKRSAAQATAGWRQNQRICARTAWRRMSFIERNGDKRTRQRAPGEIETGAVVARRNMAPEPCMLVAHENYLVLARVKRSLVRYLKSILRTQKTGKRLMAGSHPKPQLEHKRSPF